MWTPGPEILTVAEMSEVDRMAAASGVATLTLMEDAGRQVANEIAKRWSVQRTTVLCGPGNNGGDGYVVARHLQARGWRVDVVTIGDHKSLKADAAAMAKLWDGPTRAFNPKEPVHGDLFVDAIFGAGLSRGLAPELSQLFEDIAASDAPIVAVDVPSGVCGDRARFLDQGQPWNAVLTVTFFRKKPAHVLYPSRAHCGEVVCVDIGIPVGVLHALADADRAVRGPRPGCIENTNPPWPAPLEAATHKYRRGHCLVVSGPAHATGAARLAAHGALRVGAGLVTVAGDSAAAVPLSASLTAVMVRKIDTTAELQALLQDKRLNAVVIGPGTGVGDETRDRVAAVLVSGAAVTVDADALSSFADAPDTLFKQLNDRCVLTPHEGEFDRLFPGLLAQSLNRIEAARAAAKRARAVVLLKGPDTVVAESNGNAVVNTNAPPHLATAGSGDVLAGIVAGLMAQGMSAFDAARTGAFLHGACGRIAGAGLIAEDLPEALQQALKSAPD
jgi:NAD(P)H-hydrate epimerase